METTMKPTRPKVIAQDHQEISGTAKSWSHLDERNLDQQFLFKTSSGHQNNKQSLKTSRALLEQDFTQAKQVDNRKTRSISKEIVGAQHHYRATTKMR